MIDIYWLIDLFIVMYVEIYIQSFLIFYAKPEYMCFHGFLVCITIVVILVVFTTMLNNYMYNTLLFF